MVVRTVTPEQWQQLRERLKPLEPQPPKKEEEKPLEPPKKERAKHVVEQKTNQQRPADTKYVSRDDNKVAQETRARETTFKDAIPDDVPPQKEMRQTTPDPDLQNTQELAAAAPQKKRASPLTPAPPDPAPSKPTPPSEQKQQDPKRPEDHPHGVLPKRPTSDSPVVKKPQKGPQKQLDPRKLFAAPSIAQYEEVFGSEAPPTLDPRQANRRRIMGDYDEKMRAFRASLENMIPEIKPGNHTAVNAHRSVYAGYISALHREIHQKWALDFLLLLDTSYPADHPLQDPNLSTVLEFVVDAKSGKFEKTSIVNSSGQMMFDAQAVDVGLSMKNRPNPPRQIISPDGKVYLHWTFWRDGRQCGVTGVSVYLRHEDGSRERTDVPL